MHFPMLSPFRRHGGGVPSLPFDILGPRPFIAALLPGRLSLRSHLSQPSTTGMRLPISIFSGTFAASPPLSRITPCIPVPTAFRRSWHATFWLGVAQPGCYEAVPALVALHPLVYPLSRPCLSSPTEPPFPKQLAVDCQKRKSGLSKGLSTCRTGVVSLFGTQCRCLLGRRSPLSWFCLLYTSPSPRD